MANWLDSKPKTGRDRKPYYSEQVDMVEFPNNQWVALRLIGPIVSYGQVWFEINKKAGGKANIPKISLDYNPETQEFEDHGCPYRALGEGKDAQRFATNAIVRDLQELKPKNAKKNRTEKESKRRTLVDDYKCYIKEKGSKSFTPVRVFDMPGGVADKLKSLSEINTVKNKKSGKKTAYDLADPKYGCDILVKYNKDAAGAAKWEVQKDERTELTEEELNELLYQLNQTAIQPDKKADAKRDAEGLKKVLSKKKDKDDSDDDDDDDDEDNDNKKKKKRKSPVDDDDDDDEDEKPKKKKKPRDEDDDDDDEDEKPKKKKLGLKNKKAKKKKKSSRDDDDDDDLEDLDD